MKSFSLCSIFMCLFLGTIGGLNTAHGQILNAPTPADNPNLPGNSAWTAACASDTFNEYFVNFTWSPPLVEIANEFILELSDANGDFSSPRELAREDGMNTTFDFNLQFELPTDVRGSGYRFRVRSTLPAKISPESGAYPMYYIGYKNPILISQDGNGTIPSGGIVPVCTGNTVTLATHNVDDAGTYEYNWYRDGVLISERSNSITSNQAGSYQVEIDYGAACSGSANTLSNTIEVTITSPVGIALNTPTQTALCSGDTVQLEANINDGDLLYTWYKDGVEVAAPLLGNYTFTVNSATPDFEGAYTVAVEGAAACREESNAINITATGSYDGSIEGASTRLVLPGIGLTLNSTTTADTPTYQWFRNNQPMAGETNASLTLSDPGDYFLRITQTGGACPPTSLDTASVTVESPVGYEVEIAPGSGYAACQSNSTTLVITTIFGLDSSGGRTDYTSELQPQMTWQWYVDGGAIPSGTALSLDLTSPTENGVYTLEGAGTGFTAPSNSLAIQLATGAPPVISPDALSFCPEGQGIMITSDIDLSSLTFEWTRDGISLPDTTNDLEVSEEGTYRLVLQRDGCTQPSNELVLTAVDDSGLEVDAEDKLLIRDGSSRTVTASGGDSYQWFDPSNTQISSSSTASFDSAGQYVLIATIGGCQFTRFFQVELQDTFDVPNTISPNGDGFNDVWVLPNTYSGRSSVRVDIFDRRGRTVFSSFNYQNNWPESSTTLPMGVSVYYYDISDGGQTKKRGTITVVRN